MSAKSVVGAAVLCVGLVGTASAQSPEALGQRLAQSSCAQCHGFAKGEGHGVGPNLYGLVGRPAAASDGFAFSKPYADAMRGRTWDAALLDRWLADTQTVAPGSGMVYFQDDPTKRAALIAYLQTLK
jgi:cytochrome c